VRAALLVVLAGCALGARGAPPDLVIEAELTPARVYVGGEARLRLRLLRAPGVPHGVLRPPALGDAADTSLLGPIRTYEEVRAGVTYEVLERTHVIVPRRAGRLVLPGAEFESALRYAEVFQRDSGAAPRTARGPERVLEVRAPPAGAGEPWLPARRLTLEESWSRGLGALAAGTPVTRTLVVRAEGLAADRLPRLEMAAQPGLIVHHDQPELVTESLAEGLTGRRVQRIVLMPVADAVIELPELSVRWWDVAADAPRTATLPGWTLRVGAALAPEAAPEAPAGVAPRSILRGFAAALLLVSVLVLWWYERTERLRDALRALREACRRHDARAARDALREWWQVAQPGAPVPLVQRMGEGWDAAARAQLDRLDAALYADRAWDGKAFWGCVRPWLRRKAPKRPQPRAPALAPLHKLQALEYPVASSAAVHFGQGRSS
jgi:hypothetical protein